MGDNTYNQRRDETNTIVTINSNENDDRCIWETTHTIRDETRLTQ